MGRLLVLVREGSQFVIASLAAVARRGAFRPANAGINEASNFVTPQDHRLRFTAVALRRSESPAWQGYSLRYAAGYDRYSPMSNRKCVYCEEIRPIFPIPSKNHRAPSEPVVMLLG